MASNETTQQTKTQLMSDLGSIKKTLDASDDHAHEVDDDDVPILTDDVIFEDDHDDDEADEADASNASLNAAIRQLESMELSMKKSDKKPGSLEEKIRNTAAPPAFREDTRARDNPFLNSPAKAQTDTRKPGAMQPKQAAASKAVFESKQPITRTAMVQDNPLNTPVEFTDNQFLKSSTAKVNPNLMDPATAKKANHPTTRIEEDGSEEILKLLGEQKYDIRSTNHYLDAAPSSRQTEPARSDRPAAAGSNIAIDALVEEIFEEYKPVLEAALRKKLKEKMLDMLKK
jgi:hypothetical protein